MLMRYLAEYPRASKFEFGFEVTTTNYALMAKESSQTQSPLGEVESRKYKLGISVAGLMLNRDLAKPVSNQTSWRMELEIPLNSQ